MNHNLPDCVFVVTVVVVQSLSCDPMDHRPPGPFVHGVLSARILEWVSISSDLSFYSFSKTEAVLFFSGNSTNLNCSLQTVSGSWPVHSLALLYLQSLTPCLPISSPAIRNRPILAIASLSSAISHSVSFMATLGPERHVDLPPTPHLFW